MFVVLQTLALPLQNAITRHMEAEADWVALETTQDPDGARSLFQGFAREALTDPDPAVVVVPPDGDAPGRSSIAWRWPRRGATGGNASPRW